MFIKHRLDHAIHDLNSTATNEEDMSSPMSDNQKIALDETTQLVTAQLVTTQFDGTTQASPESNEKSIKYGVDFAPVGNLISVVEDNTAGC